MANWYERHLLPHIIRLGCGCRGLHAYRAKLIPQAKGRVLELGFGAGANLALYDPTHVGELIGIEPSQELRDLAAAAPRADGLKVMLQEGSGEQLPFEARCFDTVVCTFTLCSVTDVSKGLAEARRVLRPGGQFLFCEHGAAPDPKVARWQHRLEPAWKRLFGGCHLTRPVRGNIERHFSIDMLESRYQPRVPRPAGWFEWGRAVAS